MRWWIYGWVGVDGGRVAVALKTFGNRRGSAVVDQWGRTTPLGWRSQKGRGFAAAWRSWPHKRSRAPRDATTRTPVPVPVPCSYQRVSVVRPPPVSQLTRLEISRLHCFFFFQGFSVLSKGQQHFVSSVVNASARCWWVSCSSKPVFTLLAWNSFFLKFFDSLFSIENNDPLGIEKIGFIDWTFSAQPIGYPLQVQLCVFAGMIMIPMFVFRMVNKKKC